MRGECPEVYDQALIDASPEEVFRALVNEHDGVTDWWSTHQTMRLRQGTSFAEVGAVVDNTVRVRGKFPIHFTTRTVEVEPNQLIRIEYIGGSFRGEALWRFEEVDGQTNLSQCWRTKPAGALRILAPLLSIARSHSDTMRAGFARLRAFLEAQRRESAA